MTRILYISTTTATLNAESARNACVLTVRIFYERDEEGLRNEMLIVGKDWLMLYM